MAYRTHTNAHAPVHTRTIIAPTTIPTSHSVPYRERGGNGRRQDGAGGGAGAGGAGSLDGVLSTVFGQDGLPITTILGGAGGGGATADPNGNTSAGTSNVAGGQSSVIVDPSGGQSSQQPPVDPSTSLPPVDPSSTPPVLESSTTTPVQPSSETTPPPQSSATPSSEPPPASSITIPTSSSRTTTLSSTSTTPLPPKSITDTSTSTINTNITPTPTPSPNTTDTNINTNPLFNTSTTAFSFTTTSFTTFTDASGQVVTSASIFGTNLAPDDRGKDQGNSGGVSRSGAIGGAIGGLVLLLGLLAAITVIRRRKLRRKWLDDLFTSKAKRPLLDAEFDVDDQLDRDHPRRSGALPLHSREPSYGSHRSHGGQSDMGYVGLGYGGSASASARGGASHPPSWSTKPTDPFATPTPPGTLPRTGLLASHVGAGAGAGASTSTVGLGLGPGPAGGAFGNDNPYANNNKNNPYSDSPRIMRARASETGSIFREEGVWPPPAERSKLVDPLTMASSQVSLVGIVDDVMGPSTMGRGEAPNVYKDRPKEGQAHARMTSEGFAGEGTSLLGQGDAVSESKPNWLDRKVGRASGDFGQP